MGILYEQTSERCDYKDWKNGDGVNRPKITVSKSASEIVATYQGPETGFCIQHAKGNKGDSLHQLAGVVRVVVSTYLKELYSQGVFVKPDLNKIEMVKRDNFFQIKIPFVKTTEDKAITNFNERGGWGHSGSDQVESFLSTIENNPQYGMIDKATKVASGGKSADITETWISFRDLKTYPIKGQTSGVDKTTIKGRDFDDLRTKLKEATQNISIDPNSVEVDMDNYTVSFSKGDQKIQVISLIFDNTGDLQNRLKSIKSKNPTLKTLKTGKNGGMDWVISII